MRKAAKILIGVLSVSALIGTGFASWTINYGYKTKTSSLIAPEVVIENYASFGEFIINLKEEFDGETPKASPITFDAPADPMYNNINLGFVGGKEDLDVTYILKAQGKTEGQDPYSLSSIDRAAYDGITSEYIPDVTITTDIVDAEGNPVSDTLKAQVLSYVRTPEQVKGSDITIPYEAWLDPQYKEKGYEHTLTFGWGALTNNINPQIYFLQEENHKTPYEFEQYLSNLKEVLYDSGIRFQFTFRIGGVDAYAVGATFDVDVTTNHVELLTEPENLTGLEAGTVVEFVAVPEQGYENPVVTFNGQVVEDSFTIIRGQNKLVATATLIDTTVPVSGITLNKEALALEVGGSETLTATVLPENATDKTVTWSSSNGEVATVENGLVTAVAAGEATITATAGNFHAECVVTVSEPTPAPVEDGSEQNPYSVTVAGAIAAATSSESEAYYKVTGYVVLRDGSANTYIADEKGTYTSIDKTKLFEIYNYNGENKASVEMGAKVEVVAKIKLYNQLAETGTISSVTVLEAGHTDATVEATIAQALEAGNALVDKTTSNGFYKVSGYMVNNPSASSGKYSFDITADGQATSPKLNIYKIAIDSADLSKYTTGTHIEVEGYLKRYGSTIEITEGFNLKVIEEVKTQTGIAASANKTEVNKDGTVTVSAEATYDVGANTPIAASDLTFTVLEGDAAVTNNNDGTFTALEVAADTTVQVQVAHGNFIDTVSFTVKKYESGQQAEEKKVTLLPSSYDTADTADINLNTDDLIISVTASTVTADQFRIYKGQTISFSGKTLKKIVFTCTAEGTSKYGPGCFAPVDGYSYNEAIGTWEGEAEELVFTASTAQVRCTSIEITYLG